MSEMTIGQLARQTGLTVRTLLHYDQIGLLSPSRRSATGYRLYGPEETTRLTQILLLRRLRLPLMDILEVLGRPEGSLRETIRGQIAHLKERIELQSRLLRRLEEIDDRLERSGRVSIDRLTQLMEMMTMHEKYYTPEQQDSLKKRRQELGEETIRAAEAEWPELIARMQEERAKGSDPESEEVQALAKRWQELIDAFTGGDDGIAASLGKLYNQEPQIGQQMGLEPDLMHYVGKAMAGRKPDQEG